MTHHVLTPISLLSHIYLKKKETFFGQDNISGENAFPNSEGWDRGVGGGGLARGQLFLSLTRESCVKHGHTWWCSLGSNIRDELKVPWRVPCQLKKPLRVQDRDEFSCWKEWKIVMSSLINLSSSQIKYFFTCPPPLPLILLVTSLTKFITCCILKWIFLTFS